MELQGIYIMRGSPKQVKSTMMPSANQRHKALSEYLASHSRSISIYVHPPLSSLSCFPGLFLGPRSSSTSIHGHPTHFRAQPLTSQAGPRRRAAPQGRAAGPLRRAPPLRRWPCRPCPACVRCGCSCHRSGSEAPRRGAARRSSLCAMRRLPKPVVPSV